MINRYERLNQELKMVETKRKVAAYCRVSTDNEDQANSFESQQRYFRQYIERNPDWELYEIFADEGISGTNTKKRKEFNRMIRPTSYPTKKSTTVGKRNLLSSKTITSRLSPVNCSMKQTEF